MFEERNVDDTIMHTNNSIPHQTQNSLWNFPLSLLYLSEDNRPIKRQLCILAGKSTNGMARHQLPPGAQWVWWRYLLRVWPPDLVCRAGGSPWREGNSVLQYVVYDMTFTHTDTQTHTHTRTHAHTRAHARTHTRAHTHTHAHTHTRARARTKGVNSRWLCVVVGELNESCKSALEGRVLMGVITLFSRGWHILNTATKWKVRH